MNGAYRDDEEARGAMLESLERENENLQVENEKLETENRRLRALRDVVPGDSELGLLELVRAQQELLARDVTSVQRSTRFFLAMIAFALLIVEWLRATE